MAQDSTEGTETTPPWPQQLLDSIWLLAGLAIVFWALSYIIWGLIDLMSVPAG